MSEAAVELLYQSLREFSAFMKNGGFVMWPLVVATVLLWYGIGYRAMMLRRGTRLGVRSAIALYRREPDREPTGFVDEAVRLGMKVRRQEPGYIRRQLDDELFFLVETLSRYRVLVRTIVAVAPLAGLLGTVTGMIEMFQSLGDQTFFSQSGGVANGISQALVTTQFGLVIAVPGMIVGRLLDRRENRIRNDIDQIKETLSVPQGEERAS
jgi:biopolymer transport protein ExbB